MDQSRTIVDLNILSERLCLDFVNTVSWHLSDEPNNWLKSYDDLVTWSERVNILSEEQGSHLRKSAMAYPSTAEMIYKEAISLREVIFRMLLAYNKKTKISLTDLTFFNSYLQQSYQHIQLNQGEEEFQLVFEKTLDMDCMIWEIVHSTTQFLTSSELGKLKLCEGGQCGWMFLDTSKNHSRRWCSMEDCGNRAKARRHYQKKQKVHNDR